MRHPPTRPEPAADAPDRQAQLDAVLQRSAHSEALASLTAGIAHDFNNLLTVLVGNLYLVAEEVRGQPQLFEKVKAARDAGKRGADLIRQLLAFARREELRTEVVDPCKVVADLAPLLRRALGKRLTLETDFDGFDGAVRVNVAQLESAIVNLAVNARDAIKGKGTLRVRVGAQKLDPRAAAANAVAAGRYVVLAVADDGPGIPPDVLPRVLEPFFSTKHDQGGTGLGLSMVKAFAEQSGGGVEVESTVGRGTTVTIRLPSVDAVPEALDKTMPLSTLPTGHERILVLSAEDGVRATVQQILDVLGYSVRLTSALDAALAAHAAAPADVLIVDAAGLDDALLEQAVEAARAAAAGARMLLLVDGRAGRRWSGEIATLVKPFSLADLAGSVRATLDGVAIRD